MLLFLYNVLGVFMYILLFPCFMLIWFLIILVKDRRSLWSGFALFCLSCSILFTTAVLYVRYDNVLQLLLFILALSAIFVLLIFPFIFVLTYFIQGIQLIRHEGFSFHNMLSILFSIGIVIYMFCFPRLVKMQLNMLSRTLLSIISFSVFYLFMIFAIYYFSSIVNRFHIIRKHKLDYIVILGCGVLGEKLTPLLKGRIDKALQVYQYNPNAKIICSGGQGEGEDIPEAIAMKRYLLQCGIPEEKIIVEDQSTTTEENLIYSSKFMEDNTSFALVTKKYHVLRSLLIARKLDLYCIGYGSKTKFYFALNAELREFIGYLELSKAKHITVFVLYTIFVILIQLITLYR